MEVDINTEEHDITRSDSGVPQDTTATGCNQLSLDKTDTSSNTINNDETTRSNDPNTMLATRSNSTREEVTTRSNTNPIMGNPFESECDEDEKLDDLGPELVKMGRILAREITKSLSKALICLQNEINELKSSRNTVTPCDEMRDLKEENEKLKTKVDQLELNNSKLKEKLNTIEDKLLENNLLFLE